MASSDMPPIIAARCTRNNPSWSVRPGASGYGFHRAHDVPMVAYGQRQQESVRVSLKGKVAVVTGSTSGIGLGIARALGAAGADLMLNGFGDPAAIERERAGLHAE